MTLTAYCPSCLRLTSRDAIFLFFFDDYHNKTTHISQNTASIHFDFSVVEEQYVQLEFRICHRLC